MGKQKSKGQPEKLNESRNAVKCVKLTKYCTYASICSLALSRYCRIVGMTLNDL